MTVRDRKPIEDNVVNEDFKENPDEIHKPPIR